jgi:hypothetical protein
MNNIPTYLSITPLIGVAAMLITDVAENAIPSPNDRQEVVSDPSEDAMDLALSLTFPASDPPAWTKSRTHSN